MDVYKISIALAMNSNHAAVLSALSAHLLGVHTKVNQLNQGFNRLKLAVAGALSVTAGMALLGTMEKLVDKTKDFSDELVKLERLGGAMEKAVASGDMANKAFDISQRVPMKVTDLLKIPGAAYSILGQEDAMKVWEPLARFQWTLASEHGFKGDASEEMAKFLRAGELGGRLTDPTTHKAAIEELQKFLDLSSKVMTATHGMVTPSTMLGMAQQAGFSMRDMTDEGFMNMAITAQAMGGPRAGTALLSLYNQVATGKMTKPAALGMQDLGLLKDGEWYSDHGKVVVSNAAQARLGKLLGSNPMDFVEEIYKNLEAQGVTDPQEQKRRVAAAMSRQTSERFAIEMMMNHEQIAAERARMAQALGSDQSYKLINDKSVTANLEAMKNAWDNFLIALAGPNNKNVIDALQAITGILNSLQKAVRETNPDTISKIGIGIAALAGAFTVAGVVALIAALGPAGWLVLGIVALGTAVAALWPSIKALAASEWDHITRGFNQIKDAISSFINWLATIADKVKGFFSDKTQKQDPAEHLQKNPFLFLQKFEPGSRQDRAQYAFSLNVDGDRIAQAIIEKMEARSRYDTNTPSFNGASTYGA